MCQYRAQPRADYRALCVELIGRDYTDIIRSFCLQHAAVRLPDRSAYFTRGQKASAPPWLRASLIDLSPLSDLENLGQRISGTISRSDRMGARMPDWSGKRMRVY